MLTEADFYDKNRYRLSARLSIQKDDVQAVLPIAKVSFLTLVVTLIAGLYKPWYSIGELAHIIPYFMTSYPS